MKNLGYLAALVAIALGLMAIFKIVVNLEIAIGFVTISFGILAIIWTSMALKSLSPGSSLKKHTATFLVCLIFILMFSIWHTMEKLFEWRKSVVEVMLYPGYFFITAAFLIFVFAAYQILVMGKEFGFSAEASKIKNVIKEKKKNNKHKPGLKAKQSAK
ncbi:hypothetical protein CMO89_03985 [Candidatus Woesearchaeota archaeon]|nr:hypothetical protein [Candidatus Woesearchaeota archaeon]|tara:strand:- start:4371 stop:4847 length:477 start_codon:yes stop_codon:yes gene_type:complete